MSHTDVESTEFTSWWYASSAISNELLVQISETCMSKPGGSHLSGVFGSFELKMKNIQ
jgi:hypothetical protein